MDNVDQVLNRMFTGQMSKTLIYVSGPTGIGKTSLSIDLAKKLKTEIISCDSRQFYKELKIGTSPPTDKQLKEVNHHFIFNKSIIDNYNVGDYERDSIDVINNLFKTREYLILVGGSGLYADSILFGIDSIPKVPIEIKNKLNLKFKKNGLIYLQDKLKEIDLEYYKMVDLNNPRRLIRAIGVYEVSGKKISSLRKNSKKKRNFNSSVIMIKANRDKLYERINQRVDKMIKDGLEEEANGLVKFKEYNALNTVGYKEFFLYFDGKLSKEEAINKIKQNTRNYAKRQTTWFKKYNDALGYKIDDNIDELLNKIPKNE